MTACVYCHDVEIQKIKYNFERENEYTGLIILQEWTQQYQLPELATSKWKLLKVGEDYRKRWTEGVPDTLRFHNTTADQTT